MIVYEQSRNHPLTVQFTLNATDRSEYFKETHFDNKWSDLNWYNFKINHNIPRWSNKPPLNLYQLGLSTLISIGVKYGHHKDLTETAPPYLLQGKLAVFSKHLKCSETFMKEEVSDSPGWL